MGGIGGVAGIYPFYVPHNKQEREVVCSPQTNELSKDQHVKVDVALESGDFLGFSNFTPLSSCVLAKKR